ncbi:MAG: hypothetical protein WCJ30_25610 [Deltaproteobacteria bacterium]
MSTKEALQPSLIDKRVVERNIKKGLVSRETFDKHLQSLPDVAEQAETVRARLGDHEESADDSEEESDGDEG